MRGCVCEHVCACVQAHTRRGLLHCIGNGATDELGSSLLHVVADLFSALLIEPPDCIRTRHSTRLRVMNRPRMTKASSATYQTPTTRHLQQLDSPTRSPQTSIPSLLPNPNSYSIHHARLPSAKVSADAPECRALMPWQSKLGQSECRGPQPLDRIRQHTAAD